MVKAAASGIHERLISVTGIENAFSAEAERAAPYHELFGFIADRKADFAAAVLPGDVEELQAVVRLVRAGGFAVWSTPNAAGNGATITNADRPGVIVDLQRMNRIIEVDAFSASALVEPGVSYQQLYDYLEQNVIPLWIDCDRDPRNSIAGSICSRQVGYTPYGDHVQMQCGMEVVLPDGGRMRTGMGALPRSDTWQLFKYSFGPYLDGLFTQSDLALVTKIGFWLMPEPPVFMPFMLTLSSHDALRTAVERLRPLTISQVVPNTVTVSHGLLDAAFHRPRSEFSPHGRFDGAAAIRAMSLGVWNVYGALYGGKDNVDLTWEAVEGALGGIDGVEIHLEDDRADDPVWRERRNLMRGIPSRQSPNINGWGGPQCMSLTAAAPIDGDAAVRMHDIVQDVVNVAGIDYLCEYLLSWRTMLKRIHLPYDRDDVSHRAHAVQAAKALIEKMTKAGYGIVNESLELRHVADEYYRGTRLDDLVGRVRRGIYD